MDYKQKYDEFLGLIENRIIEVIPNIEPKNLYEPFSYIMKEGGKRLRPVLTLICAGVFGEAPEKSLNCAAALEIFHNFTLVHDDIMDNSPLRRGRQTLHEKWDQSVAILTGDVMIGYAYKLLPNSNEHSRADEIRNLFTKELIEVCEGQVLDMVFNQKKDVKLMDYMQMIDKKTARLIETSAVIGAHIGLASKEHVDLIRHFSRNIGLAFQIQDDLLDMTADQNIFGKKIGKDIIEGKKTFLILTALQNIENENDKHILNKFISQNGLSENEVPIFDEIFKRNGIYNLAQKEIDYFFDTALNSLKLLKQNFYSEMLIWLLNSLNKRIV